MDDQDSSSEEFPSHGRRKAGRPSFLTDDVSEGESDGAVDLEDDEEMEEDESGSESDEEDSDEEDDEDSVDDDDDEDSGEEEEGSESEGEEEEEEEDDGQAEEDGQEDEEVNGKTNATNDAGDEEAESCPICLNEFELQEVGTPVNCQHNFCIDCILEWSKNTNSCPVDRKQFNTVLVRPKLGGKVIKKLKVSDVNQFADAAEEEEEDNTYCQVCHQPTNEDRMLLCDSCDAGYHMECLTPPLDAVPIEEWFCPHCAPPESSHEEEEVAQTILLPVLPVRRAIARTMASERVRARVSRVRAARSRAQPSGPRSASRRGRGRSTSTRGRSTSRSTSRGRGRGRGRRRGTTRRKTTRSRSTTTTRKRGTKRKTTTSGTTVKRRRRKKRRKGRKVKRVVVKKETPTSVKSRLAERLQLGRPIPGSSVPSVKKAGDRKADFVQKPLMVFGDPNGLHCFEDSEGTFPDAAAVPVTSRHRRAQMLSKSALRSHRPVRRAMPIGIASELASSPTHATADATLDVLGSIFAEQELLHVPSSDVRINRDGTLSYGRTDTNGTATTSTNRGTVRAAPRGEHRPNRATNGVPSNQSALGTPPESQGSAGTSSSGHNNQGSQQGGTDFTTSPVTSGSSTANSGSSQDGQHLWGPLGNQGATSLTTGCLGNEPNRNTSDDEKEEGPSKRKSESMDSFKPQQDSKDESNSSAEESGSRLFSHSQRQWKPIQINIKSSLPHTDTSPVQGSVTTDLPDREEPQEGAAGMEDKLNTPSHSSGAEEEYNPFSPTASPDHGEEGSGSVEYNPFSPTPEEEDEEQSNPSPESETNNNDLAGTSKEPWEVEDSNDMADMGGLDLEPAGMDSPGVDSLHIDLDNLSPQMDREETEEEDDTTVAEGSRAEGMTEDESIEDFQFEEELDEFPLQKSPETFAMSASPVAMETFDTAAVETPNIEPTQQAESKKSSNTSKSSKAVLDMFSGLSPNKERSEGSGDVNQEKPAEADSKREALYEDVLVLDSGDVNSGLELHDVENVENEAEERQSQPVERRSGDKDDSAPAEVKTEAATEGDKNVSYFTSRVTHAERPTSQEGWDSSDEDTLDIRPLPNIMDLPKIPKIRQTVTTSREKEKAKDKSSSSKGKKRRRDSTVEGHQKERTKEKKRDRDKRKDTGEQAKKRKSDAEEDVSVSNSSRRKRMKAKRSSSRRQSREREKRRDESLRVDRSSSLEQEGEGRADRSHRSYRRHRQDSSSSVITISSGEENSPERTRRSKSKDRSRIRSQHSSAPSSKSKGKEDRERRKYHKEGRREKNDSDKSDWSRGSSRDRKKEEKKRERKHEDGDRRSKERNSGKGREQRRSKEGSPQEYKKPKEKSPEYKREERLSEPPKSDSRTLAEKIAEKNEKLYNYGDHDYRKAKDDQKKEKVEKVKSGTLMEELRKVGKPRLQSTVRKVSNAEQDDDVLPFSSFLSPGGLDRDHRSRVEREGPRTPEYSKQKNGDQSQPGSKDEDSDEGDSATLSRFLVPGGMDKDHRGADQGQLSNSNSSSRDDPREEKLSRASGERSNLPVLEPLRPPEIKPQLTLPQSLLTVLGVLTAQKPNAGVPSGPATAGTGGGQHTVTIEATSPEDVEMRDVEESGRDDMDENIESSAVEMDIKEKMLEKLNRQERVAEEVKLALKPFYQAKKVNKEQYKEILKKSVVQVCHTKTGKIDPVKIRRLVRQYVEKYRAMEKYLAKKKGSSSSQSVPWYRQGRK
ncbi:uncharacterized protein LOC144868390 isoform X2 [Branchiostoma floridae x Branchiostoma japonicum]